MPEPTLHLPWTYELPPDGGDSRWLEGYAVESSGGERVGTVFLALRHGPDEYLVVRRGPLLGRDLPVVPWDEIDFVDHSVEIVRLQLTTERLAACSRLALSRGVRGEPAEAVRITEPVRPEPTGRSAEGGPSARRYLSVAALGALTFLTLLAAVSLASGPHWREGEFGLFALPVLLLLGALAGALHPFVRRAGSPRG
jgi:hypothetical protein